MTTFLKNIDKILWIGFMIPSKIHAKNVKILRSLVLQKLRVGRFVLYPVWLYPIVYYVVRMYLLSESLRQWSQINREPQRRCLLTLYGQVSKQPNRCRSAMLDRETDRVLVTFLKHFVTVILSPNSRVFFSWNQLISI